MSDEIPISADDVAAGPSDGLAARASALPLLYRAAAAEPRNTPCAVALRRESDPNADSLTIESSLGRSTGQ